MKRTIPIIFCFYLIFFFGYKVYSQDSKIDDRFIEEFIESNHVPGFAYSIVSGDSILTCNALGMANLSNDIPMSVNTIMPIGSISKTFVAVSVMQLWEQGKLELDEDVNKYLPFEVKNPKYPDTIITIFQLLTHTSSIADNEELFTKYYQCGDPEIKLEDWIRGYLTTNGDFYSEVNYSDWEPSSKWSYSNTGFGLLAVIVENISKKSFPEYCEENIFNPLQMTSAGWSISAIDKSKHATLYNHMWAPQLVEDLSYDPKKRNNIELCLYSFTNYPDGFLRTSVVDLSKFLIAIINGGVYNQNRILKETTLNKMLSLQIEGDNEQGLCFMQEEFQSLWGHNGGDPGIRANMFFSKDTKIGVITLKNNTSGNDWKVFKELYKMGVEK